MSGHRRSRRRKKTRVPQLDQEIATKKSGKNEETQAASGSACSAFRGSKQKKKRQPKIDNSFKVDASDKANFAVAQWAIAHDIPANAMSGPYWKAMNAALTSAPPTYKPMYPQKLLNDMLPVLKKMSDDAVEKHLAHAPNVGRTVTGDGATKNKVPLVNFLTFVPGKGPILMEVADCTDHIAEGGNKDGL